MTFEELPESAMSEGAAALKPPLPDALRPEAGRDRERTIMHVLVGLAGFVLFYGILFGLDQWSPWSSSWTEKFTDRGWTPFMALLLTFWALSILYGKLKKARRREASLEVDYIPIDASLDTPDDVDQLLSDVDAATRHADDDLLGQRVRLAIEHFVMNRDIKEVRDVLRAEGEADLEALENSYTLLRSFVWAIPILGFIGTVLGVGAAVGGFASFLGEMNTVEQIRQALGGVTAGLSVAFDTTFVALVLALVVSMTLSSVEKIEHGVLCRLHEYCQKNIIRRFPTEAAKSKSDRDLILGTLQHMVSQLQAGPGERADDSEEMFRRLAEISENQLEAAGRILQRGVDLLHSAINENNEQMMEERRALQQSASDMLRGLQRMIEGEQESAKGTLLSQREAIAQAITEQKELMESYVGLLSNSNSRLEELHAARSRLDREMVQGVEASTLSGVIVEMRGTLERLGKVLQDLSDNPIDVDVHLIAGSANLSPRRSKT